MAVINGTSGNDFLIGGLHKDKIFGGDGDDIINGWGGADELWGGDGADTFVVSKHHHSRDQNGHRDTIMDFEAGDKIDLSNLYGVDDPDGDGIGNAYHPTMANITIETLGPGEYRIHVSLDPLNGGFYDVGIDVIGAMPTEANFIF